MRKKITALLLVLALCLTMGTTAFAATSYVGGGVWKHGVSGGCAGKVYSYYDHNKKWHKASVKGKHYASSGWVKPGPTARATAPARCFVVDRAFYDVR